MGPCGSKSKGAQENKNTPSQKQETFLDKYNSFLTTLVGLSFECIISSHFSN
jgi:hypothetical protein